MNGRKVAENRQKNALKCFSVSGDDDSFHLFWKSGRGRARRFEIIPLLPSSPYARQGDIKVRMVYEGIDVVTVDLDPFGRRLTGSSLSEIGLDRKFAESISPEDWSLLYGIYLRSMERFVHECDLSGFDPPPEVGEEKYKEKMVPFQVVFPMARRHEVSLEGWDFLCLDSYGADPAREADCIAVFLMFCETGVNRYHRHISGRMERSGDWKMEGRPIPDLPAFDAVIGRLLDKYPDLPQLFLARERKIREVL